VKVIDGVSWGFSDLQATQGSAARKTIALRLRKTGHVAEAVSTQLAAAISE